MEKINDTYFPKEALVTKKTVTTNTKENRFLKFMLLKLIGKLDKFILKLKKLNNNDTELLERLLGFKKKINKRIKSSLLRNILGEYNEANLSLVFSMGNGYKEVYKYYLMLQKGLSVNSNIFSLSMKELSLLYEYWCFIKINSLLKKKYTPLKRVRSTIRNLNRDAIIYAPMKKARSAIENLNNKDKLLEHKDIIKNPSGDINNCIFGAFVLFPYDNEEEFKNNKFY